ncbi:type 1 glutamine amidotransferase [bacterium]|nr:type 1 glutamine amidotransferase [bacterium]
MNILLVDGNEKDASDRYSKLGMDTQFQVYEKILKKYSNSAINITTIHPAIYDNYLPLGLNLDDFEAVAWTGSLLNIYNETRSTTNQIELAKELFKRKNKIFGSCWGLQVLVTAAGGKVRKNPNGLEAVLAKNIKLNQDGEAHPMYKNKKKSFNALCWHYDEAENLPKETKVLASNKISQFQSISFEVNQSSVWAVQYHPEFNPKWMIGLMEMRKDILLEEKVYENLSEFKNEKRILQNSDNLDHKELQIYDDIVDEKTHSLELSNWLKFLSL